MPSAPEPLSSRQPVAATASLSASLPAPLPGRNVAVDAYRGFVMLLMMAEVLQLAKVAEAYPASRFWRFVAINQTHVEWVGCSLHDLIQPSFSFLVGVALPYSLSRRLAKGASVLSLLAHTLWRSLLLIALGIFLRSIEEKQTNFTFEDTLTQIGLGYPLLVLLGLQAPRRQWMALAVILAGTWLAWALYPVGPATGAGIGLDPGVARGFAAHWSRDGNLGLAFDRWFLNLFPREKPFVANEGAYLTLNFIPTLGTMILGLAAGRWLREMAPAMLRDRLIWAGVVAASAGLFLHYAGLCPAVKRIWTPSWTLLSGGACFLLLALFLRLVDDSKPQGRIGGWAFPLVVIGMNSIAAYLMAHLLEPFLVTTFQIHGIDRIFALSGAGLKPLLQGSVILLLYVVILHWMHGRRLFLKI